MIGKIPTRARRLTLSALVAGLAVAASATAASAAEPIYTNLASPMPTSVNSVGFEATSTSEFGSKVKFGNTARKNPKVTVLMASWACQHGRLERIQLLDRRWSEVLGSGHHQHLRSRTGKRCRPEDRGGLEGCKNPVPSVGEPYEVTGANTGLWYSKGECVTSKTAKVTIPLKVAKLPEEAIISVSYNTSNYGYNPTGCAGECPEDSLNVGVTEPPNYEPTTGSNPSPEYTWLNSSWAQMYEPEPHGAVGTFSYANEWTGYQPLFEVKASS